MRRWLIIYPMKISLSLSLFSQRSPRITKKQRACYAHLHSSIAIESGRYREPYMRDLDQSNGRYMHKQNRVARPAIKTFFFSSPAIYKSGESITHRHRQEKKNKTKKKETICVVMWDLCAMWVVHIIRPTNQCWMQSAGWRILFHLYINV